MNRSKLNACTQQILKDNYSFMRQKICLMALIESVFKRGAYDRTLSYRTISEETHLPVEEVEHLVMKGLRCAIPISIYLALMYMLTLTRSLNLLKGHLDQVEEKAYFTWVQPPIVDVLLQDTMQRPRHKMNAGVGKSVLMIFEAESVRW